MVSVQQIRIYVVIVAFFVVNSCNNSKATINTFFQHKERIMKIKNDLCSKLSKNEYMEINSFSTPMYIHCRLVDSSSTYGIFLNRKDLSYFSIPDTLNNSCRLTHKNQVLLYKKIVESKEFNTYIKELIDLGFKGMKIGHNSLFITQGVSGSKLKHPDICLGILISDDPEIEGYTNCIKKIDEDIFLYETVL